MENKNMLVYSNEFFNFANTNEIIHRLNKAIDTSYIPSGDNLMEVLTSFHKIQSKRTFSDGFSCAGLRLIYDEQKMQIVYESTSKTCVEVCYLFDQLSCLCISINITVDLPEERIGGRCYEALMAELYPFRWTSVNRETKEIAIVKPPQLQKLEDQQDYIFPVPDFVLDMESNWYFESEDLETVFAKYGYKRIKSIGYKALWHNPSMYFEYIQLEDSNSSWMDNKLFLLTESDNAASKCRISYRKVLELLEERKIKPTKTTSEYDEYDESEYSDEYSDSISED